MASIKKLKSKGVALTSMYDSDGHEWAINWDYDFRKKQFASLPPAKLVKPLKALRVAAAGSFDLLRRALVVAKGDESSMIVSHARADFTFHRTLVAVGRKLADRGDGVTLHNFAVRHTA